MSALLYTFWYSPITQLFYTCKLLNMTSWLIKNNMEQSFMVYYSIKNFFCSNGFIKLWKFNQWGFSYRLYKVTVIIGEHPILIKYTSIGICRVPSMWSIYNTYTLSDILMEQSTHSMIDNILKRIHIWNNHIYGETYIQSFSVFIFKLIYKRGNINIKPPIQEAIYT